MTTLLTLPNELLIQIGLSSGFFTIHRLRQTCKHFNNLFSEKAAWREYAHYSPDEIGVIIRVLTVLNPYDLVLFGEWTRDTLVELPKCDSVYDMTMDRKMDNDLITSGSNSNSGAAKRVQHLKSNETMAFFEHISTNPTYNNAGGIKFGISRTGRLTRTEYFQHRNMLPCFPRPSDDGNNNNSGLQRLPSFERVNHSCEKCCEYDDKMVTSFTEITNEMFAMPASMNDSVLEYVYTFPDGKRRVHFRVEDIEMSRHSYHDESDVPMIITESNVVFVDGRKLVAGSKGFEVFRRFVQ